MSEHNCDCGSNDSGFILGIVVGAVIGAAVAIYIYKNNKSDVFIDLKAKLENYFKRFTKPKSAPRKTRSKKSRVIALKTPSKIPVVLPKKVVDSTKPPKPVVSKSGKMFTKPQK